MRHRSNDLFSCPGTFETKSLGSRQISAKGCGVKGSIRNVLWNRNRESHFLSLQELKRLSRHHLSHDETLQWARHQAIGENDKLIKTQIERFPEVRGAVACVRRCWCRLLTLG